MIMTKCAPGYCYYYYYIVYSSTWRTEGKVPEITVTKSARFDALQNILGVYILFDTNWPMTLSHVTTAISTPAGAMWPTVCFDYTVHSIQYTVLILQ